MNEAGETAPASGPTIQRVEAVATRKPRARAGFRRARPALARRRRRLGIERRALARQLEIPEVTLWKIERRRLRASPDRQRALARELEASVDELFALERPRPEKPKRPRGIDAATVEAMAARYEQGLSYKTVGREFGRAESTVRYLLVERRGIVSRPSSVPYKHPAPEERVCAREGCDERFTPTGYQAAQPGGGRFCSRACHYASRYVAEPEERVCAYKGCGKTFAPYPSEAVRPGHGECCSMSCRGKHFFATGQMEAFVKSLKERGLWGPKADRRWRRLWNGLKGGGSTLLETAEEDVRTAARRALDVYRQRPDVPGRDVVALVVQRLEGRDALFHPSGRQRDARDPVRRKAEKRAMRRLEAACTLPEFAETLLARDFG